MKRRVVLGFPRTIYELGEETKGFLDPWSSLRPVYLQRKIAPEILGVFKLVSNRLKFEPFFRVEKKFVDPRQLTDRWALVLPKRSYLPPNYPHLQLWLLSRDYVPSPRFMTPKEIMALGQISQLLVSCFQEYSLERRKKGKIAFGFNSTPFSFIKDQTGRYYAGGQSARAFHVHFLLIPPPKKLLVDRDELFLIYPTTFSLALLKLLLLNSAIQRRLGFKRAKIKAGKRGIIIQLAGDYDLTHLWKLMKNSDRLLYRLQALLARSFYEDADRFLAKVKKISQEKEIARAEAFLKDLVVVGEERELAQIKKILTKGLRNLARSYGVQLDKTQLFKLGEKLALDETGDLVSFVFGQSVVLRPGMGYAMLLEKKGKKIEIRLNPLDVLGSKGLIESSGYWFEKKIVKKELPYWAVELVTKIIKRQS